MAKHEHICVDCGKPFVFTDEERAFYLKKGIYTEPKRCLDCRSRRRQERKGKVMYPFKCAQCGYVGHVPFLPNPNKPLLCLDCLRANRKKADKSDH